jgi:hypothetical protein
MGLFGSSTKTTVGTSVSRVIKDDQLPNAVLEGITGYLFNEDNADQLVESVMDSLVGSIGNKASQMYNYGRDKYTYGLPSGSVHSSMAGKAASKAVIESQVGTGISMVYYHFGPLNNLHIGWKVLTEQYGYDAATNEIVGKKITTGTTPIPVFLKDMQVVVTNASLDEASNGSLDQWGIAPNAGPTPEKKYMTFAAGAAQGATSFAVDPAATSDYVLVTMCWEEPQLVAGTTVTAPVLKYGTFTIPLTGFDFTADWHQAKYVDAQGHTDYWMYRVGDGHADLDSIFDVAYDGAGHFFPWAYFRYGKVSMANDLTSVGYKTSKKLVKFLNMDYDQIIDAIHENPDIADVEQAMMVMAVPANSTNATEIRYLFDFFSGLYEQVKNEPNAATNDADYGILRALSNAINKSTIIIQDARFKMALNWRNIVKRKVAGTIGAVGTYKGGADSVPSSVTVPSLDGTTVNWDTSSKRHWYQHQIAEGVYEEVHIFELKLTYYVFEQYTTTGDETDEILLIPVDISIANSYTIQEREVLYTRALHYVFNSRVVTKLKWYQTGAFQFIMVVIAIVITVFSMGSAWQTIGAALAAGAIPTLVMILVEELIKYLVLSLALKLFVRAFGQKVAFIVAIVAAIAGTYQAIDAGSVNGAPWAKELLAVSSGLSKAITMDMKNDIYDLLNEQTEFEKFIKEQTKLLEDADALLTHNEWLAPLIVMGETSTEFFQRTVHSGNIGAIGLDAVSSYVDVALTLPKPNQIS